VDLGHLKRFFQGQAGHDGRDPFSQHGLSAARRADHGDIVAAAYSHFNCPLGKVLPLYLRKVDLILSTLPEKFV
jgi:hypothetical protein